MRSACDIRVRGVVQGVGFRPFVFRLAKANTLDGWVLNDESGVEIHLEGADHSLDAFVQSLKVEVPPAARITEIDVRSALISGFREFTIRESRRIGAPTARISPDLPVCDDCLAELFDHGDRHYLYPYINCTNCGPRYSVVLKVPYDRANTTMNSWPLDEYCGEQYVAPANRRFHAQPVACPDCGPHYYLQTGAEVLSGDTASIAQAAQLLSQGAILAIKGLGGFHLACDARNALAVQALRERKFRKESPFALMARDLDVARTLVALSSAAESLLVSQARPIVLARAFAALPGVSPENDDLGVMLPYAPVHHLLFAAGAPEVLVMTSANRSSEPIAYEDRDALERLSGIADAFLMGERPIARRVDDSIARAGVFGPVILRRSRGYAPSAVAAIPATVPILAVGADLKNTITLVLEGQAFVSQHIGDLAEYQSFQAFRQTIQDMAAIYGMHPHEMIIAHDSHPQYFSSVHALDLLGMETRAVQHHRAHVASVLAERGAWDKRVLGVSFDGTGYGDDGAIWGGELFAGSVVQGFEPVGHLREAALPGGDAAARYPVQAAAGFLCDVEGLPDLNAEPFLFPESYQKSLELVRKGTRTFQTTSVGRLFDVAAALLGFIREATFEGQAAMWVEHLSRKAASGAAPYPFPACGGELDFRPLLSSLAADRRRGRDVTDCARAFQLGLAQGLCDAVVSLCDVYSLDTVVLSGGVFQNQLLLADIQSILSAGHLAIWTNREVPPNDGGISLGQAAIAALGSGRR
jgi:hydrogenase maturation protein HypF